MSHEFLFVLFHRVSILYLLSFMEQIDPLPLIIPPPSLSLHFPLLPPLPLLLSFPLFPLPSPALHSFLLSLPFSKNPAIWALGSAVSSQRGLGGAPQPKLNFVHFK